MFTDVKVKLEGKTTNTNPKRNNNLSSRFPWKDIGEKAYLVYDVRYRPDLTITTKSAHVKVVLHDGHYTVRLIVYDKPRQRSADHELEWTPEEIHLAFNLEVDRQAGNDPEFARSFDAEFGIKDKFVRIDDRLVLFCTDWLDRVFHVSILIDQEMKDHLVKFVK